MASSTVRVDLKLPAEIHKRIKALAELAGVSMADVAKVAVAAEVQHLNQHAQPVGWITAESLNNLVRHGGNGSRGSVPIHRKRSNVAKYAVALVSEPPEWLHDLFATEQQP